MPFCARSVLTPSTNGNKNILTHVKQVLGKYPYVANAPVVSTVKRLRTWPLAYPRQSPALRFLQIWRFGTTAPLSDRAARALRLSTILACEKGAAMIIFWFRANNSLSGSVLCLNQADPKECFFLRVIPTFCAILLPRI